MVESAPDRAPRKAAIVFVFITVALDMIALGVVAPVFVPLVERFMHENVVAAASVVGAFGTVFALMQFVWAPVMGVLSDRFGRRPIIVLSNRISSGCSPVGSSRGSPRPTRPPRARTSPT
jgi:DHA1 family tetracycline resistance protein-like MFS transporter